MIHWRTEGSWLARFLAGEAMADIAYDHAPWESQDAIAERVVTDEVEDAIRRALLRRERRKARKRR